MLCTVDLFTLCSAESRRIDLFGLFSIARLIASMLAVDLPVFCLPLRGASSTDQVSKNLLTIARMVCFEGLPCLRSKSKCFTNFVWVSEIDFVSASNRTIWIRCFTLYFLLWAILEHSTQYEQCFKVTWVNISDSLLCPVCSDAWKCVAPLAVKRLIMRTWKLLIQSKVLQIMGSKYHAHLKYFEITDGVVFGIKKIVQVSSFQICIWFCNATFTLKVIQIQSGKGTFGTPCI